jgi:hypothetical protein
LNGTLVVEPLEKVNCPDAVICTSREQVTVPVMRIASVALSMLEFESIAAERWIGTWPLRWKYRSPASPVGRVANQYLVPP